MEIRELKKEDKEQMLRLISDFLKFNRSGIFAPGLAKFEEISDWDGYVKDEFEEYLKEGGFVASENDNIIGFIVGSAEDRGKKVYKKRGMIDHFYVIEGARGKGTGTKLLESLKDKFRAEGCDCLSVGVYTRNGNACEFYRKFGFIEWYNNLITDL